MSSRHFSERAFTGWYYKKQREQSLDLAKNLRLHPGPSVKKQSGRLF
jgi:hypothetical protein